MTPEDYQRILKFSPEGCFIAEKNGKDVGIVVTTDYGEIAWIGNLVVLPSHRGEGIGTELMRQAINYLKSTGTQSIRLDGVPQAIPLYRRLGFKDEYWSTRHTGVAQRRSETRCKPMKLDDLDEVAGLDLAAFKAPRRGLLEYVHQKYPELCYVIRDKAELQGYIMAKRTLGQVKIGPWIALNHEVAEQLLQAVMNKVEGSNIWVGTPEKNKNALKILEENNFQAHTSSLRMCHGDCSVVERVEKIYGLGGPDKG